MDLRKLFSRRKILIICSVILLVAIVYNLLPEKPLPPNSKVDYFHVSKSQHQMEVYSKGELLKVYKVSLGRGEWGMHDREPNLTPIGNYNVSKLPKSSFHNALPISYGDQIEIHGIRNGLGFIGKFQRWIDWTRGCIAVTDSEIDELYAAVTEDASIQIDP